MTATLSTDAVKHVRRNIRLIAGVACGAVFLIGGLAAWAVSMSDATAWRATAGHETQVQAKRLSERLNSLRDLNVFQSRQMPLTVANADAQECTKLNQDLIDSYAFVLGAGLVDATGRPTACFVGRRPSPVAGSTMAGVSDGAWRWHLQGESGSVSVVDLGDLHSGFAAMLIVAPDYLAPPRPNAESSLSDLEVIWGSATAVAGAPPGRVARPIQMRGATVAELRSSVATGHSFWAGVIWIGSGLLAAIVWTAVTALLRRYFEAPAAQLGRLAQAPLSDTVFDLAEQNVSIGILSDCFRGLVRWRARLRELESCYAELEVRRQHDALELQVLQREARIGFWETDLRTGKIRWSAQTHLIFGIPVGEEITLKMLSAMMPREEEQRFAAKQAAAVQGVAALDLIHRIVRPDGTERVVHERGSLDLDESGSPSFIRGTVMDVTEAHQSATELDLLRQMVMVSSTGLALCSGLPGDPNGQILMCNPRFKLLFVPDDAAPEVNWSQLWQPNGRNLCAAVAVMKRAVTTSRQADFAIEWCDSDGTRCDLTMQINPLQLAEAMNPEPRWALIIRDVTAQRQAERALRESEQRYRDLFENHPLPMWLYDPVSMRFVDVNRQAISVYGYTAEQFQAMTLLDIRPAEDADRLKSALLALNTEPPQGKLWRHRRADGGEMTVEVHGAELRSGGRLLRIACPVNRSAEAAATQQLQKLNASLDKEVAMRSAELARSERRYRVLAEMSPQVIWQAEPDGRVVYLNPSWLALVGGSMEEWLGVGWLSALVAEDRERVDSAFKQAMETKSALRVHRRVIDRQGLVRHLLGSATPVFDELGDVEAWVGVDTDVTDLICQREQLDAVNDELEAFVYSVSHDLRAPVDAVREFARGIAHGKLGYVDATAGKYLNRIAENARRMDTLIQELLKLSQFRRQSLKVGPVDLQGMVAALAAELSERHAPRVIDWHLQLDGEIQADRELIRLALDNLLGNAVKFTAGCERAEIAVTLAVQEGQIVIEVKDNGAGFPQAYAYKLFRPFQRLHSRQAFPGTGVGLATVDRVAKRHGGKVEGFSGEGQGATFRLSLPLRPVELFDIASALEEAA